MKKIIFILIVIPLLAFTGFHKYYVSVTQVNYIKEKQTVQITVRIFVDDFENALRQRYDENITLSEKNEPKSVNEYIEMYLKDKIKVKINDKDVNLVFIGKEYDYDIMCCYIEIDNVKNISSFEISNKILFDAFDNQQNIIKTNINSKQKGFILTRQDDDALLNFN